MEYEIVRVLDDRFLIDPESYQRRYERREGHALSPGYYLAIVPESSARPRYGAETNFVGPIGERAQAVRLQHRYEQGESAFAHAA